MSLIVRPTEAILTHDTEVFSKMDPYCVVKLGQQQRKTRVHDEGGKKPRWSDTLTFTRGSDTQLTIQVWDKDVVDDDLVGEGTVNLSGVYANPNYPKNGNFWLIQRSSTFGTKARVQAGSCSPLSTRGMLLAWARVWVRGREWAWACKEWGWEDKAWATIKV